MKKTKKSHIILEASWKHLRSTILKTMDSLLPPDWGKANCRDKDSRKQVEYYFNRKTHQTSWVPPPPNFSASEQENDDDNTNIHHSQGLSSFLVQLPPPISTEGSSMSFAPTIREQVEGVAHEERGSSGLGMTALELTFDPNMLLL
jgi:hypothetical protein